MKIVQSPDVVEISGEELATIVRDAIRAKLGREMTHIHWVNVVDMHCVGMRGEAKNININATLLPKAEQ